MAGVTIGRKGNASKDVESTANLTSSKLRSRFSISSKNLSAGLQSLEKHCKQKLL